jgi:hypothetical protein
VVRHRNGGGVDQPVAASTSQEADVVAGADVVDAGVSCQRQNAAQLAGVAAQHPQEHPPVRHGTGSGRGIVSQTVRATASTVP